MGKLESDLCLTFLAILCPQVSLLRAVKEVQKWYLVMKEFSMEYVNCVLKCQYIFQFDVKHITM